MIKFWSSGHSVSRLVPPSHPQSRLTELPSINGRAFCRVRPVAPGVPFLETGRLYSTSRPLRRYRKTEVREVLEGGDGGPVQCVSSVFLGPSIVNESIRPLSGQMNL